MEVKVMGATKILLRFVSTYVVCFATAMLLTSLTNTAHAAESLDFGNVPVGSTITKSFSITNNNTTGDIQFFSFSFKEGVCDFYLSANDVFILPGQTVSIGINYSPSNTGTCSDVLQMSNEGIIRREISVTGTGIDDDEPKYSEKADLLSSFDRYVEIGALKGLGSKKSADSRLKAFRNILESAADHIEAGKTEGACGQLKAAYNRLDSFVTGDEVLNLGHMINQVITDLGCE
jgi:hypothetical protein